MKSSDANHEASGSPWANRRARAPGMGAENLLRRLQSSSIMTTSAEVCASMYMFKGLYVSLISVSAVCGYIEFLITNLLSLSVVAFTLQNPVNKKHTFPDILPQILQITIIIQHNDNIFPPKKTKTKCPKLQTPPLQDIFRSPAGRDRLGGGRSHRLAVWLEVWCNLIS